jgi:hypothetical protein
MKKKWMILGSISIVVLLVVTTFHFFQPFDITKTPFDVAYADEFTMVRRVIPGGPASCLQCDGDYVIGVGQVSLLDDDCALYLYDTNGTLTNLEDDTYSIIATSDTGQFHQAQIEGDYITYLDDSVWYGCSPLILKSYQISTQITRTISTDVADFMYDRDGDKLVFSILNENTGPDIALYRFSTQNTTIICNAIGSQKNPCVKNNIVTWGEDLRNEQTTGNDVYLYNLTTQTETAISTAIGNQMACMTDGQNYLTYCEEYQTTKKVLLYNITTTVTTEINSVTGDNIFIDGGTIIGQNVTYVETETENGSAVNGVKLYLYNIPTTSKTLIVESANLHGNGGNNWVSSAGLYNDYIVYGGWPGVKVYNITTEITTTIRSTGDTRRIIFNKNDNTFLINSKGSGQDPNEWDITLVQLP